LGDHSDRMHALVPSQLHTEAPQALRQTAGRQRLQEGTSQVVPKHRSQGDTPRGKSEEEAQGNSVLTWPDAPGS
jgi:hypothetical protein